MINRKLFFVFFFFLSLLPPTLIPVQAHDATEIYIENIWATPCQQTNNITSVFLTVNNTTVEHPIALINATSPFAEHIHLVEGDGGCSEGMTDRIVIPFGERVDFFASKYAIAVQMNEFHQAGEPFSLTLTFDMLDDNLVSDGTSVNVVIGVPILEQAPTPSDILIVTPWIRPTTTENIKDNHGEHDHSTHETAADMPMLPAAVYLRLLNRGDETDRLVAVSSPMAEFTEIHQTSVANDIVRMDRIATLDLPTDEWVAFEPNGYHIMLVNLQQELREGQAILLTLTFESGTVLTIAVPVYDPSHSTEHEHNHNH